MTAFTVLIPAYNAEKTLAATLACLDLQTERDFEVVVVDDGSQDGTGALADRLCGEKGWRVVHQENKGLPGARNAGMAVARGRWIALLDADDWYLPPFLARMRELLESAPEVGLAFADAWVWDADGDRFARHAARARFRPRPFPTDTWELFRSLSVVNWVYGAACFPRELALEIGGFNEALRAGEDWDMWLRIVATGAPVRATDERLAIYRRHSTQMSQDPARMWAGVRDAMRSVLERTQLPADVRGELAARVAALEAAPPEDQPSRGLLRDVLGRATRWAGPVRDWRLRAPREVTSVFGRLQ